MINKPKVQAYAIPGLKGEFKFCYNAERRAEDIVAVVAQHYNVKLEEIKGHSRVNKISFCRQVIIFFLRRYTQMSLKEVGRMLNKDHTTAVYAVRRISDLMETDEIFRREVQGLEVLIM